MTRDEARQYVERWQKIGPILEKIRRDELRAFCHQDHAEHIDSMLAVGLLHAEPRITSGMVEMQRLFARARR